VRQSGEINCKGKSEMHVDCRAIGDPPAQANREHSDE